MERVRNQATFLRYLAIFTALAILTISANRCAFGQQQDDRPKKSTSADREPSDESNSDKSTKPISSNREPLAGSNAVQAIIDARAPNEFAQKYGYEVTNAPFVNEIAGEPVDISSRSSANSGGVNSILSGDHRRDSLNGTDFSVGGQHANPAIAEALNSVGEGHGSVRNAMQEQMNDLLNMTGHGSPGKDPSITGIQGGLPPGIQLSFRAPKQSLYGDGVGDSPVPGFQTTFREALGGLVASGVLKMGNPGTESAPVPGALTPAQSKVERKAQNAAAADQKDRDEEAGKKLDEALAKGKAEAEAEAKAEDEAKAANPPVAPQPAGPDPDPDPTVMTDPDAGSGTGGTGVPLTPQQIQTILMKNKTPVNPDDNLGSPSIPSMNTTGLPVRGSAIDPTIALYDGSQNTSGIKVSPGPILILHPVGGGFTDTRPDLAPQPSTPK